MAHRSIARLLAPLALVGALAAVFIVIQSTLSEPDGTGSSSATQPASESREKGRGRGDRTTGEGSDRSKPRRRVYTVKSGDTLTTVSKKTGVSVEELEELNPQIDPQTLNVGQKIRLRRRGGNDDEQ